MESFKRPISLAIGLCGIVAYNLVFYLFAKQHKMSTGERLNLLEFIRKRVILICFSLVITVVIVYLRAGPLILSYISDIVGKPLQWNHYLYMFIGVFVDLAYSFWKKKYGDDI